MRRALRLPALLLPALLTAAPAMAQAQPQGVRAAYEVHAGGFVVLELEARFDSTATGYAVETTFRTRGLAAAFVRGEQRTRVAGSWMAGTARPRSYVSDGVWRGSPRRIALDWPGGEARVLDLVPPNEEEREPVPDTLRRNTVDALSAFAQLSRQVGAEGSCDGAIAVFDGRRRSDFRARSEGREVIRPWRGAWTGEALRCTFEGRQVAGFRRDQDSREAATPQAGTAWIGTPFEGAPPIPVRLDIPTRWFGNATAVLLRVEPTGPAETALRRQGAP